MFNPETEARFRKIEDDLTVAAEILRRFEMRTEERLHDVEGVQATMARWLGEMSTRMIEMSTGIIKLDTKINAIADAHIRLSATVDRLADTVDRFLKSRTNGSGN